MTTAVTVFDFGFMFFAAPMLRLFNAAEPGPKTKVLWASASAPGYPAAKENTGIPAVWSGSHEFWKKRFEPKTTAATLSEIIWFAQSSALDGSPFVTQRSIWIGCPPTPLRYWLIH